ncbi:MAG: PrgI family protein [Candidatus Saccharimonadales bacterium]
MATYKVIQDIEAEDKLLGPLTLRQFIYAGITVSLLFGAFMVSKTVPFLAIPFILPALVFGFLSAPWGKDQPTETWAVAKVRFLFKPRKRIWDQSGQKDLVNITVPKKEIINYTNGLSQNEVKSRLEALASTIDTRGWVIKDASYGQYQQPVTFGVDANSDRLVSAPTIPQLVPEYGSMPSYDVLDEHAGIAQQFDQMIAASERTHRQQVMEKLAAQAPTQPSQASASAWFNPTSTPTLGIPVTPGVAPSTPITPTLDEETLLADLEARGKIAQTYSNKHLHTIQPLGMPVASPATPAAQTGQPLNPPVTAPPDDTTQAKTGVTSQQNLAILDLARNDDLSVDTLARQAKKKPSDEVVISLR